MKYIVGIDGGTQSTKVTLYDVQGNTICQANTMLRPLYSPDADTAEHPDDDLWDTLQHTCSRMMQTFTGDPNDIVGIGLGSIRCCRTYLDKNGLLVHPIINWMDKRLEKPYPGNIPGFQYIATTTAYLTVRLTGQLKDTAANYEGIYGPFNKETWSWSDNPQDYEPYNITRENLFDLVMPGERLGFVTQEAAKLTGLPEGCPVFATANDKAAEGLGAGIIDDGTCLVSLGTYIGGMVNGNVFNDSAEHYWSNLSAIPHTYLYEGMVGIRRGMWSVSWFRDILGKPWEALAKEKNTIVECLLDAEAESIPSGSEGLVTIPEFMAPVRMHYRKALMIGFDGRHKRAHIYRSILESIAMTIHISMADMFEELNYTPKRLIISGGGANSKLFMRIFADVFGMPCYRNEINDAAGLGAAICTAVGLGIYPDHRTAVSKMVRTRDYCDCNPENTALYHAMEENIFREIKTHTDPVNKEIYKLFR